MSSINSELIRKLRDIDTLVIDIDGTITNEIGLISTEAIELIRQIEKNGVMVSLASGNAYPVVKALAHYIGASGPIIAESGCVLGILDEIYVFGNRERILEAFRKIKDIYKDRVRESWSNIYRHVDIAIRPTIPKDEMIRLVSNFKDVTILDSKFAYHIHPRDIDKGYALEKMCELMNLSPEYIAAIGDSELDYPMLLKAGFKVALRNAPDSLKRIADYVTKESYYKGFIEFARLLINAKKGL